MKILYFLMVGILFALAFWRGANMYITVDEAITYTDHIRPTLSGIYDFSAANNHLLNTILAKVMALMAPYNELAIRLPSLVVGGWFFMAFLPSKLENWRERLLFASLCLFPYYISEYWSMSRGYFMSGCFAAAALIEVSETEESIKKAKSHFLKSRLYAGLSVLASFVMLPFSMVVGLSTVRGLFSKDPKELASSLCRSASAWFLLASCSVSAIAIYTFRNSGEALAYTNKFSVFAPVDDIIGAGSVITGSPLLGAGFKLLIVFAVVLTIVRPKKNSLIVLAIVASSLFIIWVGGTAGTGFPIQRSWIPYWFPFCLIITYGWREMFRSRKRKYLTAISIAICFSSIVNNLMWYTPNYAYYWRSNYYQAKALFYHSSLSKDFCLPPRFKGDKVLIFYWDNPRNSILAPRDCSPDEPTPYGFTSFAIPGETFDFPEQQWGKYLDAREK